MTVAFKFSIKYVFRVVQHTIVCSVLFKIWTKYVPRTLCMHIINHQTKIAIHRKKLNYLKMKLWNALHF